MFKLTQLLRKPFGNYYVLKSVVAVDFHSSSTTLAGHSKWANIKHTKGLKDGQRALEFGRLSRTIRLAVQGIYIARTIRGSV